EVALAGGVNLILVPDVFITASKARMLAPDGRCKTFAASADGFGRGEGCGVIVLKRLSQAVADGDRILGVIRGSDINQDGATSGLTVPNRRAQEAMMRRALANAGIEPNQVQYVEAHGTGTPLGDPIEVRALASVLGPGRPAARPFLLGPAKTNIGPLEPPAGTPGRTRWHSGGAPGRGRRRGVPSGCVRSAPCWGRAGQRTVLSCWARSRPTSGTSNQRRASPD